LAIATFDTETAELVFDSEVTLEHIEAPHPDYALAEEAQTFPFAYSREERLDLVRALERQHPAGEVDRWADGFLPKDGRIGTMALLRKITLGIREQLTYSRRYERGVQTPAETLAKASGTCRDYAFLMIEGVRSLGLAARFVSGYIFVPNTGDGSVNGGGSTHAWLQVYLPGAGWVDFDPTNSIVGNRNLIRVAVAWAPAQALPLWGTYTGPASCFLGMDVSVSVKDEAQPSIPPVLSKL
jgi:hypothetical protein